VARDRKTDTVTGVETTGHEWDGIRELDNPLPRWWLWVFYASILWAVVYWILMPAWPGITGYTKGLLGYSNRGAFAEKVEAARAAQSVYLDRIRDASVSEINSDPELLEFSLAGGRSAFAVNCSQCHGSGAQGGPGYPNLNDDNWLWGGDVDAIYQTIRFGVRSDHPDTRQNIMPAFLDDGILDRSQVNDVATYVQSLSGSEEPADAVERGGQVFAEQCVACHQEDAKGSHDLGAPNLTDAIWLYGGTRADIVNSITHGRSGVMPAWAPRLESETVKQLAVYVHSLGGGE